MGLIFKKQPKQPPQNPTTLNKIMHTFILLFLVFTSVAQDDVGKQAYLLGKEQEQNASSIAHYQKAFELYKQAADLGYDSAQVALAQFYELGLGTEKSYTKAADYYQRALEKGNAQAAFRLGNLYEKGYGVNKSMEQAAHCYLQAWGGNYPKAKEALERIDARRWLPADLPTYRFYLAVNGDKKAQFALGKMYLQGCKGNHTQWIKAKSWLEKSAEQDLVEAQLLLAQIYEEGKLTEKNISLAQSYYEKAARQNDPTALLWLENKQRNEQHENTMMLASTNTTSKTNTKESISRPTQTDFFEEGLKAWRKDLVEEAYTHFQKVSPKQEPKVWKYLGVMHKDNLITNASEAEAITYLTKYIKIAPEDAEGFYLLGQIYLRKNQKNEAKYYFDKAEEKGYTLPQNIELALK